jgi:non-lysosomal glucosylceramidase
MALSILNLDNDAEGYAKIQGSLTPESILEQITAAQRRDSTAGGTAAMNERLTGAVSSGFTLKPGEEKTVTFVLTWWFPYYRNVTGEFSAIQDIKNLNRQYENRFRSAAGVADYVTRNFNRLAGQTRLWNKTWYDSTLPYWLLDRSFISLDCLATETCHWFDNGRFYGWEGVTCCPGTCQHVWNYAQGLARIFPQLERVTREMVDYGIAFRENGALDYRAESARHVAHDGQCGTILRAYREHQMSPDDAYLKRNWRKIKKSIEFMINQDGDENGLIEGEQYNTLDQAWVGPMAWISSMYVAAVAAGNQMAREVGDFEFARRCEKIVQAGRKNIVAELYDGEYFIHKPTHFKSTNTNDGCHIDQVFGQSFAWQLHLDRILPSKETKSALRSLWKYNFTPDAGGYRNKMQKVIKGGRWYAMQGEAGLLMCTWPKGGAEKASGTGKVFDVGVGYFNECMNGFEYQVASHMVWEGLVKEGLAITRAVHDRYHPSQRNPYNEIECSDHYSRSMASYGVFLAACGYEYHGPKGYLAFSPENFKAPFTTAQGWGTFSQERRSVKQNEKIEVKWGKLRLKELAFELPEDRKADKVKVTVNGKPVESSYNNDKGQVKISLAAEVIIKAGEALEVELIWNP